MALVVPCWHLRYVHVCDIKTMLTMLLCVYVIQDVRNIVEIDLLPQQLPDEFAAVSLCSRSATAAQAISY